MNQWARYEGGGAAFNPMNTTWVMPGSTPYNAAGVQNYVSAEQGTQATVNTLRNGYYSYVLAGLLRGDPGAQPLDQIVADIKTWGTVGFAEALQNQA